MQAINIIFDTNVLITDHSDCKDFVAEIIAELAAISDSENPPLKLALDVEGEIQEEYYEQFLVRRDRGEISDSPNLKRLYDLIHRLPKNSPLIAKSSSSLPDEELGFLESKGCGNPIEPSIFGIAYKSYNSPDPEPTFVYLMTDFLLPRGIPRGYPHFHRVIGARYLPNNDHYKEVLKTMLDSGPRPETWKVVDRIISSIRACGSTPMEGERHEFKGTKIEPDKVTNEKTDTGHLTDEVWDDLPKTVCSMLNKDGGYIFLGVREKPTYEVTGFKWRERGGSPDEVQQKLVNHLKDNIFPFNPEKVKPYVVASVPDSIVPKDKMLIAIQVKRKSPGESDYRANGYTGKKGKQEKDGRKYHKRAVWCRCGSQVLLKLEQ